MKKTVFCITGLSATGKTTICDYLNTLEYQQRIVQCTTRPKREDEQDGIHYNFVKEEEFAIDASVGKVVCFETYKVASGDIWLYGYMKDEIYDGCIIPVNPTSIEQLKNEGYNVVSINLILPEHIRLFRVFKRSDNQGIKEIYRRTRKDKKEFKKYKFDYNVSNRNLSQCLTFIREIIDIERCKK